VRSGAILARLLVALLRHKHAAAAKTRRSAGLGPGDGERSQTFGPLALVPRRPAPELLEAPPTARSTRRLCATPLDWLEVIG
jgi:hypothetical protein